MASKSEVATANEYSYHGSNTGSDGEGIQAPSTAEKQIFSEAPVETKWSDDCRNPHNWSTIKKSMVFFILMMTILNSCLGSSLTSNAIPFIVEEFDIESQAERVLPISCYLIGYVFGPLLWAPTSEHLGRRKITIGTFFLFTLFTMACALAKGWAALLIFRLLAGIFASGPIAVAPGMLADIYKDPKTRGRAVALYMVATSFGPLLGPIISGFASPTLGWQWSFWIGLIIAGVTLLLLMALPETYAPTLRASHKPNSYARADFQPNPKGRVVGTLLFRPLQMLLFEPIVTASSAYLALVYSIFYMSFQAYPIIFQDIYSMSPGICGLAYLPVGAGCIIFLPIFWLYDDFFLVRAQQSKSPFGATHREEYLRLPLACLGGPLFAISLFWLGWSARENVSFAAPLLAGVPFGFGFICIFIAILNYLTDAYEIYAASANAASSCSRSLLAAVLPLATRPMFDRLGVAGACSLLGGLSTVMCVIPFVFIWKGDRIRAKSRFCNALRAQKEGMSAPRQEISRV